jgi:hypothetical protein
MLVMRQQLIDQAEHDTAPSQPVSQRRASGEPCIHRIAAPFARHMGGKHARLAVCPPIVYHFNRC